MRISYGLRPVTPMSRKPRDLLERFEARSPARNWCTTSVRLSTGWAKDLMSRVLSPSSGILPSMGE